MIYDLTVTQFSKMLKNLDGILDKAAQFADAKKIEASVLLNSRLAPDQFHFTRQVQIACDSAKMCVAKLTNKDAPKHEDTETTIAQLRARLADTITYLATVREQDFTGALERRITTPRWEGKTLSGFEYALQHSIPNVYFHITLAYEILRHNGMEIGKKDFLGAMPFKS